MNANFSLEDPETFNDVLPWSSVVTDSSQAEQERAGLINTHRNTAKLLQEKVGRGVEVPGIRSNLLEVNSFFFDS